MSLEDSPDYASALEMQKPDNLPGYVEDSTKVDILDGVSVSGSAMTLPSSSQVERLGHSNPVKYG